MNNFRKLFCVFICICSMLCVTAAFADAPVYKCSAVVYTDSVGTPVYSIAYETTVKSSITVECTEGTPGNLMFAMMLYENKTVTAGSDSKVSKKLLDTAGELKPVGSSPTTYSAEITIPADDNDASTELELVAVLWDSAAGMKALIAPSTFPNSTNVIRSLSVNGVEATGFNPDTRTFDVLVDANEANKPNITFEATDSSTVVTKHGGAAFPGTTVLKLSPANGSTPVEYTVNYTAKTPLCAETPVLGHDLKVKTADNYGSKMHSDRPQPNGTGEYTNEIVRLNNDYLHLLGSDYLMTAVDSTSGHVPYNYRITLYRDATIYTFTMQDTAVDGWNMDWDWYDPPMVAQDDNPRTLTHVHSKDFIVTDPTNGCLVELPFRSSNNIAVVKYKDYTTVPSDEITP